MLRLNVSPDAIDLPRRSTLMTKSALASSLGATLACLLMGSTANAQPAQERQHPAAAVPTQPPSAPAQPGANPTAYPPTAQPSPTPPQSGAGSAQPFPQPQYAPPTATPGLAAPQPGVPQAAPGYAPPGYYGNYPPPYGNGYYPPPGYYYPMPQAVPPAPAPALMQRKSQGMMVGGIALTGGGVVSFFVGTILLATANNRYEIYCDVGGSINECETRDDEPRQVTGAIVTIAGGILLGVGIPLWVIGGKKVPVQRDAPAAAFQPALSIGPGSATVRMAF